MPEFTGKVAIVTGAGSGLGEAIAKRLHAEGAQVALADIDTERVRSVARRIDPSGDRMLAIEVDVADAAAAEAMVKATVNRFGGLHLAVNNAGFTGPRDNKTGSYKLDDWRRVMATNLDGIFYGLRYQIPVMATGGVIVNMSSAAGLIASRTSRPTSRRSMASSASRAQPRSNMHGKASA